MVAVTVAPASRARRELAEQQDRVDHLAALLSAAAVWSGLLSLGWAVVWLAGRSPGLAHWPGASLVLGVALAASSTVLVVTAAARRRTLQRLAAVASAVPLAAAAVLVFASTDTAPGAVGYMGVAGLHVLWALRSG